MSISAANGTPPVRSDHVVVERETSADQHATVTRPSGQPMDQGAPGKEGADHNHSSDEVDEAMTRRLGESSHGESEVSQEHILSSPTPTAVITHGEITGSTPLKAKLKAPQRQWPVHMKLELVNRVMSHKAYTGSTKTVGEVYEDIYREFIGDSATCEFFRDKKPSMLRSHWDQLQQSFSSWRQSHEQEKGTPPVQLPPSEEERKLKDALVRARDEISCFRAAKRRKRGLETPEQVAEQDRIQTPRWRMIAMPSRPEDDGLATPMVGAETASNDGNPDGERPTIEFNGITASNETKPECVASEARVSCDGTRQEIIDVERKGREDEHAPEKRASDTPRSQGCSQGADEGQGGHRGREKRIHRRSSRRRRPAYGVTEESLFKILEHATQAEEARRVHETEEKRAEREFISKRDVMQEKNARERWEQERSDGLEKEKRDREERADVRRMDYDRERDARAERRAEREAERQVRKEEIESRERIETAKNEAFMKMTASSDMMSQGSRVSGSEVTFSEGECLQIQITVNVKIGSDRPGVPFRGIKEIPVLEHHFMVGFRCPNKTRLGHATRVKRHASSDTRRPSTVVDVKAAN